MPLITRNTNETYEMEIRFDDGELYASIYAITYFGARHGLETLFQLIEYDDILHTFIIVDSAIIIDYPEFRHRGIMIDTAKNFVEPIVIKRIIDGMASSKVNHELTFI